MRSTCACRRERIVCLDHHTCHAAAAYYGSGWHADPARADALVLTNDNSGDGLCATASTGRGLDLTRREASPSAPGSLGAFYSFVTAPPRDEVRRARVQGDGAGAVRAGRRDARRAETRLRRDLRSRGGPTRPASAGSQAGERYQVLLLERRSVSASTGSRAAPSGCSRTSLLRWTRLTRERYGGARLALGGGVFMNVKANMLLAEEEWVRGALRVSVVRRRVERGGRRLSRIPRGVRAPRHRGQRPRRSAPRISAPA